MTPQERANIELRGWQEAREKWKAAFSRDLFDIHTPVCAMLGVNMKSLVKMSCLDPSEIEWSIQEFGRCDFHAAGQTWTVVTHGDTPYNLEFEFLCKP